MYNRNVIHRDLKLGNLFINENMEVKIGDFGLAAKVVFDGEKKRTIWGTPNYIAPEVLSSRVGHSYEVDLWSLGVITFTMLFGRPPFETRDVKLTYRKIKSNNYSFPSHVIVSDESKDFIRSLLKTDPKSRLGLDKIMDHEFLQNYPDLLPASTLSCPPSRSYISQFVCNEDTAPKPGNSPCKAPNAKDIATFEWDLADNEDAQIMSNRRASLQSHRRMESQDRFIKTSRPKEAMSNERDYVLKTERGLIKRNFQLETSSKRSPARNANYWKINLTKAENSQDQESTKNNLARRKSEYLETSPWNKNYKTERAEKLHESGSKKTKSSISIQKASRLGPEACGKVLIAKWIDYSSKYGVGYKLSNGIYGVLFNDSTKIVLSKDEYQFYYLKREISSKNIDDSYIPVYNFGSYPDELKKKVILTQHFISYLLGQKFIPASSKPTSFEEGFGYVSDHVFLK